MLNWYPVSTCSIYFTCLHITLHTPTSKFYPGVNLPTFISKSKFVLSVGTVASQCFTPLSRWTNGHCAGIFNARKFSNLPLKCGASQISHSPYPLLTISMGLNRIYINADFNDFCVVGPQAGLCYSEVCSSARRSFHQSCIRGTKKIQTRWFVMFLIT